MWTEFRKGWPLCVTRHRASTSMYSLTFCIRVMSSERHHWKPTVQAAAVMLRTPPIDGHLPASQPRPLAIYGAQCWERLRHLLVINQQRACTLRKLGFALYCHSNATGAPIENLPNSAQLGGSSTTPPSYIRVRAVKWAYGRGQTHRQTDTYTHRHTDARDHNTFCVVYDSRKMSWCITLFP